MAADPQKPGAYVLADFGSMRRLASVPGAGFDDETTRALYARGFFSLADILTGQVSRASPTTSDTVYAPPPLRPDAGALTFDSPFLRPFGVG